MLLNKEEIKELINGVWTGKYNRDKLPYWLFDKTANGICDAIKQGWGATIGTQAKDVELLKAWQNNTFYFAANKTAHELNDLNNLLNTSVSRTEFIEKALKVDNKYNRAWYETEYNTSQRLAKSGREWRDIEDNADVYEYLQYVAVNDANTRAAHKALDGIIKPVNDAFWSEYFPPLDWACRCRVKKLLDGKSTDITRKDLPKANPLFTENVAKSKAIWSNKHPYFKPTTKSAQQEVDKMVKVKTELSKPKKK